MKTQAIIAVQAKDHAPAPDPYQVESGVMGVTLVGTIIWGLLVTAVAIAVFGGGILWWVGRLNGKVSEHDKKLEEELPKIEANMLKEFRSEMTVLSTEVRGSFDLLRRDISYLQQDLNNSRDSRSQTLANQQREIQELKQSVQGNIHSSPGYYEQRPSGRHDIQQ